MSLAGRQIHGNKPNELIVAALAPWRFVRIGRTHPFLAGTSSQLSSHSVLIRHAGENLPGSGSTVAGSATLLAASERCETSGSLRLQLQALKLPRTGLDSRLLAGRCLRSALGPVGLLLSRKPVSLSKQSYQRTICEYGQRYADDDRDER